MLASENNVYLGNKIKFMKKLIIFIGALLITSLTTAQVKDSFELRSIPTVDMDGNVYIVVKYYNHIPTLKDSVEFEVYRKKEVSRMIKEVEQKEKNRQKNDKASRFTQRNPKRSD